LVYLPGFTALSLISKVYQLINDSEFKIMNKRRFLQSVGLITLATSPLVLGLSYSLDGQNELDQFTYKATVVFEVKDNFSQGYGRHEAK
jgi:hypothetical protein